MARRSLEDNPTAHTLEEIQNFGDKVVERISANPVPVLAIIGGVLLVAAIVGGTAQYRRSAGDDATAALESARLEYIESMGGTYASPEVPEPANPETARRIRAEYAETFLAVAAEHPGTPAATLARLEAGDLRQEMGDAEAAVELWRSAAAEAAGPLKALLLQRIAHAEEAAGRFSEAGEAYVQVGEIADYPLRYEALGDAARCFAEAGDPERAVALYRRITAESPETRLTPHVAARLRELEAAQR